jgi:UDP-4-amino-4,6-dideoxy-N-acetyl-beta-L-altrosamine transaminase
MIPYGRQDINDDDILAVMDVLRSDFLTQGPAVPAFEKCVTDYCNVNYAVALNSATSALHIACLALGVGKGDVVWTSPISFVASANCALYCGAHIDFVDIDPHTYNMSVDCLSEKLQQAEIMGNLPKVVIPVHLSGQPCDMEKIRALSLKYKFKIIEDASHAIGAKYKNRPVGNCEFSDITVFSFHPVKIITTGEGGMALTNNEVLAKHLRLLRSHGISNDLLDMQTRPANEIWNYQQVKLGFNYRMTDIQAALGLSQMKRVDDFVRRRHVIAGIYDKKLNDLPLQLSEHLQEAYSAHHLYVVRIKQNKKNITQRRLYDFMQASGVNVNLHYIPIYRQPYYEVMGFKEGYCPEAEQYYKETLSIPMYPTLCKEQQEKVIDCLNESFK